MADIKVFEPVLALDPAQGEPAFEESRARFANDAVWLLAQGGHVERFNLGLQPLAFAELAIVKQFLVRHGMEGLPLVIVRNRVVLHGRYPTREELARYAGLAEPPPRKFTP